MPVPTIGFLHTSDVHLPTFRGLVAERAPDLAVVDLVDASLLDDARARGVDDDIRARLESGLVALRGDGATVIVCTCSTLAGVAEEMTATIGTPVIRVDRPMAERAASIGGRIAVVVAVESTLAPTKALLAECISSSPADGELIDAPCLEAWALFEAGDADAYAERLVEHAHGLADEADVVVLAQASMDAAAHRLADLGTPVLCSPSAAVDSAVELALADG